MTREKERINLEIAGVNEDLRLVWAWASVSSMSPAPDAPLVVKETSHGPCVMSERELLATATRFGMSYDQAKDMHRGSRVGTVVQNLVFTRKLQEALGIEVPVGWLVVLHVADDRAWELVKNGERPMLSIGGWTKTRKVADDAQDA